MQVPLFAPRSECHIVGRLIDLQLCARHVRSVHQHDEHSRHLFLQMSLPSLLVLPKCTCVVIHHCQHSFKQCPQVWRMDQPVQCVSYDNAIHIVEDSGSTVFNGAESSMLLGSVACVDGTFSLPVSQHGLNLLKEAKNTIRRGEQWSGRRFSDLGRVAEVCEIAIQIASQEMQLCTLCSHTQQNVSITWKHPQNAALSIDSDLGVPGTHIACDTNHSILTISAQATTNTNVNNSEKPGQESTVFRYLRSSVTRPHTSGLCHSWHVNWSTWCMVTICVPQLPVMLSSSRADLLISRSWSPCLSCRMDTLTISWDATVCSLTALQ